MRNSAEIVLRTNIGFATIDLYAKYWRNQLGANIGFVTIDSHRNTAEIRLGTNIGFVTIDLHPKYKRNRIGNKHMVCNRRCIREIPQKSHWAQT